MSEYKVEIRTLEMEIPLIHYTYKISEWCKSESKMFHIKSQKFYITNTVKCNFDFAFLKNFKILQRRRIQYSAIHWELEDLAILN